MNEMASLIGSDRFLRRMAVKPIPIFISPALNLIFLILIQDTRGKSSRARERPRRLNIDF